MKKVMPTFIVATLEVYSVAGLSSLWRLDELDTPLPALFRSSLEDRVSIS
jgi:hypothetical protein